VAVCADRTGKGIRAAARDTLIAASAAPGVYGLAFGVHRALDTVGALGGPPVAFAVLAALPTGYDAIFLLSFSLALVGAGVAGGDRARPPPGRPAHGAGPHATANRGGLQQPHPPEPPE
jgi:hypothetical protein